MSKKSERITMLIGCRNALNNNAESGADGKLCYSPDLIKRVLATLDATLKLDGIVGIPSDAKVNQ